MNNYLPDSLVLPRIGKRFVIARVVLYILLLAVLIVPGRTTQAQCPTVGFSATTVTTSTAKLPPAPAGSEWRPNGGNTATIDNNGNISGLTANGTYSFLLVTPGTTCGSSSQLTETIYNTYNDAAFGGQFAIQTNGSNSFPIMSFGTLSDVAATAQTDLYGANSPNTLIFQIADRTIHYDNTNATYTSGTPYKMTVNYNPLTDVLTYTINGQTLTFQPKATNTNWPTGAFMSATMLYLSSNAAGLKVDVSDIKLNGNSVANNSLTIENGEKALVISGYDYYNGFNVTADVVFTYNSLPSAGGALFFDYKFGQTNGCTDGDNGCITEVTVTKTNPPTPVVNITATPGPCVPATNTYSVSGTLSLTNASAGTALITDGTTSTSVAISSGATSVPYSLTGLTSGTGLHTVSVSYASQTASTTYTAPTSCSVAPPCGISLNATPGLCAPATNTYILSGTINTTNVPSAGTLTISSAAFSPRSLTLPAGNASGTFSYSGLVSNGQTYTITASYSNSACAPVSQIYTAPASCSVAPVCSMSATVTAGLCASATNTYSATAVVRLTNPTAGVLTVTNGAQSLTFATTAVSSATYTAVFNGLTSDGATRTVTATLAGCGSTSANYTAPASCSSTPTCPAPITVCAGSNYAFEVSGPEGMTSYQWYRNGQAISNATSYSYTITQEGSYSLVVNNNGVCPNGSCCPVVIVEEPVPSFTAVGTAPTCTGTTSLTNGQITLTGLGNYTLGQYTYQYVRGTTFVESTSTIPAAAVPLNGIVLTNLSGGDVITIRVYNAATGCYTDQTVTIPVVSCECPPSKCVPFVVKKIRSTK